MHKFLGADMLFREKSSPSELFYSLFSYPLLPLVYLLITVTENEFVRRNII